MYAHFTRLPPGFDYYWGYLERASVKVVQDRFHMSEVVYAMARGEPSKLSPEVYRLVDARLRLLGSYTVLVTADSTLIAARWDKGQMYSLERTLAAARGFMAIAECMGSGTAAEFPGYQMDIDYTYHCNKERPYVDEAAVAAILRGYEDRRRAISEVLDRRPYLP